MYGTCNLIGNGDMILCLCCSIWYASGPCWPSQKCLDSGSVSGKIRVGIWSGSPGRRTLLHQVANCKEAGLAGSHTVLYDFMVLSTNAVYASNRFLCVHRPIDSYASNSRFMRPIDSYASNNARNPKEFSVIQYQSALLF
jgi:hypothetical protein